MLALTLALSASWPNLQTQPQFTASAPADAAMIVGVETYANAPTIPGAFDNAAAWYQFFSKTMLLPPAKIALLRNNEATLEKMRKFAQSTAQNVGPGGTVWFVFIGHGAPARDGKDGLLLGYDAQQDIDSIEARSLRQHELLATLGAGKQARTIALIDACFSGKGLTKGLQPLVAVSRAPTDKAIVLTAAKGDQFAGALPGLEKPAFSYLALGGLRGWADANNDQVVTADELLNYTNDTLRALLKDRTQTPDLLGNGKDVLFKGAREKGPDVSQLVLRSEVQFSAVQMNTPDIKIDVPKNGTIRKINMAVEQALDDALTAQESKSAMPEQKAAAWCKLAQIGVDNPHLEKAKEGCWAWQTFADKQAELARLLGEDYKTMAAYVRLRHKTPEQKLAVLDAFLATYGNVASPKVEQARALRPALSSGKVVELVTETKVKMFFTNNLDDYSGLRSVYIQLGSTLMGSLQKPEYNRPLPVLDSVVQPGEHQVRADMSITSFNTLGIRVYCSDTLRVGELAEASVGLSVRNLEGDPAPRVFMRIGRGPEHELNCKRETTGGRKGGRR